MAQTGMTKDMMQTEIEKYVGAFQAIDAGLGTPEELIGTSGIDALRKITNLAPSGAFVPTVTKEEAGGRAVGYDLFSLLMTDRIVLLNDPVDDVMAIIACASLLYLDSKEPGKNINLYVNSPGGSVLAGFAIIDTMESLKSPVTTVGMGLQASMGSHILAAGDVRMMTEKSKLMIHGISSGTKGKLTAQENDLQVSRRLMHDGFANYIRHIGLTDEYWQLCDKETWFSAEQAKEIGFIDAIVPARQNPNKKVLAEESARQYLFNLNAKRMESIPKTEAEILKALSGVGENDSLGNTARAEMMVALAKMPKYWTPELKAKKEQEAKIANDNKGTRHNPV